MSTRTKLIKAWLGIFALEEELQNITLACCLASIIRRHYYEIKQAFEKFGPMGWLLGDVASPGCPIRPRRSSSSRSSSR